MKLYSESLQSKIEDLEKQVNESKSKSPQLNNIKPSPNKVNLHNFENEINNYKNEINAHKIEIDKNKIEILQLNKLIKTYEEHNLKIPELEKKNKTIKLKHQKEIKDIEEYYKERISKCEEKLNKNLNNNFVDSESNLKNKKISNTNINNIGTFNKVENITMQNNFVKLNPRLATKTIDDGDIDRVNVKYFLKISMNPH